MNQIRILRLEAAEELHDIGHRLWFEGERLIAPECLHIAARCGLPEAQADVLVWRSTGETEIDDCYEPPVAPKRNKPIAGRRTTTAVLATAAAVGGSLVVHQMTPGSLMGSPTLPPPSTEIPSVRELRILPPVDAHFSVASTAGASPAALPSTPPDFQVDLGVPSEREFVVALQSTDGKQTCNWRIVGTATNGRPGAMRIGLLPGELQKQVNVPAEEWSRLSVFPEVPSSANECQVVGGKFVPADRSPTPSPPQPPNLSPSAPPTELASLPRPSPPPESPSNAVVSPGPTSPPSPSTS
jgi:hypothetical protein